VNGYFKADPNLNLTVKAPRNYTATDEK